MKNFNELTKKELANLSEVQVDAYTDIELSNQGIVKNVNINIDYPDYVKPSTIEPERDVTIYQVGEYAFLTQEEAQKFIDEVSKLKRVSTNYDWSTGSDYKYVENRENILTVNMFKVYSRAKYDAIKSTLKEITEQKKRRENEVSEIDTNAINYEAIDNVRSSIRYKVREAIDFFERAKQYANNYDKYFQITNDKDVALKTLYTVFNIQDKEMKKQIITEIDIAKE